MIRHFVDLSIDAISLSVGSVELPLLLLDDDDDDVCEFPMMMMMMKALLLSLI